MKNEYLVYGDETMKVFNRFETEEEAYDFAKKTREQYIRE